MLTIVGLKVKTVKKLIYKEIKILLSIVKNEQYCNRRKSC